MPTDKSPYDAYKERYEIAVDAFNKAKNLFEDHRPFYHDDVSKITRDLLSQCRGYIRSVGKMLKSENFDDDLHDKADELLEKVPEAIDEIEKAIKGRIGLLQEAEIVE
jgi:tetratricopeptide (TPR) repeat protein